LVNNLAWLLRHLPVFAVGGRGAYRVRGIHVEDLARLCVELGARNDTVVVDAVGPQSVTFKQLVDAVRAAVGSHAVVLPVPGPLLTALSNALNLLLRDTLLTHDEYQALAHGLADSDGPATGTIVLTDWIAEQGPTLGRRYANDLERHFRSPTSLQVGGGSA
jgi:NADH dehydrogenase